MKLLSVEVQNFASYKHLEFKFDGQGLALVAGPTGSGKSTLCDVVPWILFGKTAKGGAADEVLSWPGEQQTIGTLKLELNGKLLQIGRSRKPNDLVIYEDKTERRGKDLNDTQKIINDILGFDLELFLSGSYFHEFSQTGQFFIANAKTRRQLTEQLVDLSLPKILTERMIEYKKEVKSELAMMQDKLNVTAGVIKNLETIIKGDEKNSKAWDDQHNLRLHELKLKQDDYKNYHAKQLVKSLKEHAKKQVELENELLEIEKSLTPITDLTFYRAALAEDKRQAELVKVRKCPVCGTTVGKDNTIALIRREHELDRKELANQNTTKILNLKIRELSRHNEDKKNLKEVHSNNDNPYVKQLEELKNVVNPYANSVKERTEQREKLQDEAADISNTLKDFKMEYADIEILLDVVGTFRAVLVKNTVVDLETNTNKILTDYFDSEIRVKFDLTDSDKLETTIWKDGNECVYTQLSKGQRQLLKLSFSISVMKCVSNHHGVNFNAIFLDEALDGLDENLKVKAYGLLQSLALEHESVFVVEHSSELKSMFVNRYNVTLTEEGSQLEQA